MSFHFQPPKITGVCTLMSYTRHWPQSQRLRSLHQEHGTHLNIALFGKFVITCLKICIFYLWFFKIIFVWDYLYWCKIKMFDQTVNSRRLLHNIYNDVICKVLLKTCEGNEITERNFFYLITVSRFLCKFLPIWVFSMRF